MDRDLSLNNINIELCFNLIFQVKKSLSANTIHNATIVRWSNQLKVTISTLPKSENIKNSHFLNVIVEHPEYIVESVVLGISHVWHQRTQVSTDSVLTVTKGPVLVGSS